MNPNIKRLFEIASKPSRLVIGLMSGTSLDGLDIALCRITGCDAATRVEVLQFETIPYELSFKKEIKKVFSKKKVNLEKLCLLNPWVAEIHADMILSCLKKWQVNPNEVDAVASHGQTVYHAPKSLHKKKGFPNATLQIGDGDHLAVKTSIITLSDFRQKHLAAGGEGAPLAAYGDYLIFSSPTENRMMVNMGGISNFTFLPKDGNGSKVFSTDTGPGNTLMDAYMQLHFEGQSYDADAAVAKSGKVNQNLLNALKNHPFFKQNFPKTTGPELFNLTYLSEAQKNSDTLHLSKEDVMATLNRFSAETLADAILLTLEKSILYLSGGGMHNPLLVQHLKELLPEMRIENTEKLGIHPDTKEAVLFAVLANQTLSGKKPFGNPELGMPQVNMGKISFPK
jgi:anhydro-N-acetylmuramic acid kinase